MTYRSNTKLAEQVCSHIGWRFDCRPIEVMKRGNTVYITGTLLKPEDWRELQSWNGSMMDGQNIIVRHVPAL